MIPPESPPASPPLPFALQVLGSGTTVPHPTRQTACYLVHVGDERILVDSGSGALGRLGALGLAPHHLQAFFYTHLHLDHVGDLFNLLFSMGNPWYFQRDRDLHIHGPPGFQAYFDHQMERFARWVEAEGWDIHTHELEGRGASVTLGPCTVAAHRVRHSAVAVGYRFSLPDGRVIAYTGDADEGAELEALLEGASLAVLDCSALDDHKIPGHLSPGPIARACRNAGVRSIVLSHFYPPLADDPSPAVDQVAQATGIPTVAAFDGALYPVAPLEP